MLVHIKFPPSPKKAHGPNKRIGIANTVPALSEDGYEQQFAVDHLAHFLLIQLLTPLLLSSSTQDFNSRVVMVSSTAHGFATVQLGNYSQSKEISAFADPMTHLKGLKDGEVNPMIAYGQAKTANIWTANHLDRLYRPKGLHALSIHPGNIYTNGWGTLDPRVTEIFSKFSAMEIFQKMFKSVEQGAATQVLAAIGRQYEGKGGIYLDDCGTAKEMPEDGQPGLCGYKSYAVNNKEGEEQLWKDSLEMVGVKA
jgi:NAD(P)-dependent dehydrogenase (short-subunit alcohol dehydrogenase family)